MCSSDLLRADADEDGERRAAIDEDGESSGTRPASRRGTRTARGGYADGSNGELRRPGGVGRAGRRFRQPGGVEELSRFV